MKGGFCLTEHYAIVFDFMWLIFKYFNITRDDINKIMDDIESFK